MSSGQRTLLIGTSIAMLVEIAGIALLIQDQMAGGIALLVLGVVIDLVAIFRWRAEGR